MVAMSDHDQDHLSLKGNNSFKYKYLAKGLIFVLKSRSKSSSKVDVNLIDPNAAAWAIAHSRRTAAAPLLRFGEIRSSRSSFTVWRALRDALYTTI